MVCRLEGMYACIHMYNFSRNINMHYGDVIMSAIATQSTVVSIVYPTVCSGAGQRKYQSSPSLAFVRSSCSNYIFILDLTPGSNGLGRDNCKTRRESFKFWGLVRLSLEVWQQSKSSAHSTDTPNITITNTNRNINTITFIKMMFTSWSYAIWYVRNKTL